MTSHPFKVRSPAKLILSGEHAVVYGKPAIALAVDRYAESAILSVLSPSIIFNCLNLKYAKSFTLQTLEVIKKQLQEKYHDFLAGRCSIREVLKKPFELLQYTVTHLIDSLNISLSEGLEIRSSSNIPIGCGMGSSAALVMSTLHALLHFFKLEIDPARLFNLGREAENLQHGYSSGLDLQLTMLGGCLRFENGKTLSREMPTMPFTVVQTGTPRSSTGQCVSHAALYFNNSTIAEDFAAITNAFDNALQRNDLQEIKTCIRANHQLLIKIGVVPAKVQAFIASVEKAGGAAKVCGAGASMGDRAGVVLVVSENHLDHLAESYHYQPEKVHGVSHGTHVI
jgi:mevalonate kinase